MKSFEAQTFDMLKDRSADKTFADMSFHKCMFDNCLLSMERSDGARSRINNVNLNECRFVGCQIGPALFTDVTATNSAASDLSIFWGSLFHRVKFAGKVSALKFNISVTGLPDPKIQKIYDDSRIKFYEEIDWAIDISSARFTSFDCLGIPARLFRLDPEVQGMVHRENVPSDWNEKYYRTNAWGPWISALLASGDRDTILATPLAKPKQARDRFLDDLKLLRSIGVVTPH